MRGRLWIAVLAVATLAGCSADFDDITTVKDLRVLAVVADPPEFVVDVDPKDPAGSMARLPDSFGPVKIRPLIVDPHGAGRAINVSAVACGNRSPDAQRGRNMGPGILRDTIARGPCPDDSPTFAAMAVTPDGAQIAPPLELVFTPTRQMVLDAFAEDPLGAIWGLPLSVQITVSAGAEQVVVRKRVIFTPRLTPEQTPNRNPTIPAITFRFQRDDQPAPFDLDDPVRTAPTVPLDTKLRITPQAEDPLEAYPALTLDRQTQRPMLQQVPKETLRYAFFATIGSFGPATSSTEPSPLRSAPNDPLTTEYRAPKTPPPGDGHVDVWVIVRDERGGESFVRLGLKVSPPG